MTNDKRSRVIFACAALYSASSMAVDSIEDTHTFRLGMFSQTADIKAVSSLDGLPPIEVDLVDDLGLDDSSELGYGSYRWRFAEKWALTAVFERLDLDGRGFAAKDFNFDGEAFSLGAGVDVEYTMDTYLIDVTYSFIRNENWEVIVGLGLHAFDIETVISGRLEVDSDMGGNVLEASSAAADVLAPLPNFRGGVKYMITPRWEVNASVGWLSLEVDDIDGEYAYADIGTEYRITEHFGIGATYQISQIDVTSQEDNGFNKLDVDFSGPSVYLSYGF
ncbi:MAG: hypothetical protein ACJAUG_002186 [Halioglobus sp.]|jgi:hypothetical protein